MSNTKNRDPIVAHALISLLRENILFGEGKLF